MAEVLTHNGRLPGVLVQIAPPGPAPAPLRLDVTGFVGFAERGPLDLPVLLEDIHQYRAIFGGDLPLAREGGRPIYAHLSQAVRAFFENGGRRCYVVRVAENRANKNPAAANQFHIPGLFTRQADGFDPVVRPAAWPGDWSQAVSVGTQLLGDPQRIAEPQQTGAEDSFRLLPEGAGSTDLSGMELDLLVSSPAAIRSGDLMRLYLGDVRLFAQVTVAAQETPGRTLHDIAVTVHASLDRMAAFTVLSAHPTELPTHVARMDGRGWSELAPDPLPYVGDERDFALNLPVESGVVAGDLLRLTYSDGRMIYFPVAEGERILPKEEENGEDEDQTDGFLRLRGEEALQATSLTRPALSGQPSQADLLTFDLHLREGDDRQEIWRGLRFNRPAPAPEREAAAHTDFWLDQLARPDHPDALFTTAEALQQRSLRLGQGDPPTEDDLPFFLPLAMSELRPHWRGPLADSGGNGDAASKNGLERFEPEAFFVDERFNQVGMGRILRVLENLLYLGPERTKPTRMHGLLAIDEVALIALPDLVHRPWGPPQPPIESAPPDEEETDGEEQASGLFHACERAGDETTQEEDGEGDGESEADGESGAGGHGLYQLPVLKPAETYDVDPLLAVQEALVTLCAAAADRVAILSLPQHFERRAVLRWQEELTNRFLGSSRQPLSYAAAYHGWARIRETTSPQLAPLRNVPPGGAACGLIAAQELARGPWIAAANRPLQGMVGLTPALREDDRIALFNGRLNVLAQQPGRFVPLSAHTLSPDRLLLQLSVRRLLIYLRKYLLREGNRWVFETYNARLRQRVRTSLERTLSRLVEQGGLAAYQVVTGDEVNTPNDYASGRFIVAVKIAPTRPIEYITVVLLRTGESQLETIER